jgi:hypothetical protein
MSNMEDDKIVWDDVKDNLKTIKMDESQIIDIGNPFEGERVRVPESIVEIREKLTIPKTLLIFCFILILLTGLFALRGEYAYSITRMSESWEPTYILKMEYSQPLELYKCTLSIDIKTEFLEGPVEVDVGGIFHDVITADHMEVVQEVQVNQLPDKKITVTFYRKSILFGRKIIHSLEIHIPTITSTDGKIQVINDSAHRFLVYSPERVFVLHSEEEFSIPRDIAEKTILKLIDLETMVEYIIHIPR